jgi:hypothetical protein
MKRTTTTRPAGPPSPRLAAALAYRPPAEILTLLLEGYGDRLSAAQHRALSARRGPEARLSLVLGQLAAADALRLIDPALVRQAEIVAEVWAAQAAPADQRAAYNLLTDCGHKAKGADDGANLLRG